jgi:hypothetical protein
MKYKTFRALAIAGGSVAVLGGVLLLGRGCQSEDKGSKPVKASATAESAPKRGGAGKASEGGQALRPMDQEILARARKGISGTKVKDAFPGEPYKVSLYADSGSAVNRLKIDLDRDGKWDEKWSISNEGGQEKVKRQVAPNDDESYTVEYRLRSGSWVKKQQ